MRMKSFNAPTLPEAMALVRDALGVDAVILSTQELGAEGVRITAALDEDPLDSFSHDLPLHAPDPAEELVAALEYHRLPLSMIDTLLSITPTINADEGEVILGGALKQLLRFSPLPVSTNGRPDRPVLLMGPPGSGKSATAAKLCARARLAGKKTCFITVDNITSGAREQAESYCRALGARLIVCEDYDSLAAAVEASPPQTFKVIDTVGINPFDPLECEGLETALHATGAIGALVLPAGGDTLECAETAAALSAHGASSLIATRIDTARRLGGLLSAAQSGKLSLMGAGIAPSIGNGLTALTPIGLSRLLLAEDRTNGFQENREEALA